MFRGVNHTMQVGAARTTGRRIATDLDAIAKRCSELPIRDKRTDDEILGYDRNGLPPLRAIACSHAKLVRITAAGERQILTVPAHEEFVAPGTLHAICRQALRFSPAADVPSKMAR